MEDPKELIESNLSSEKIIDRLAKESIFDFVILNAGDKIRTQDGREFIVDDEGETAFGPGDEWIPVQHSVRTIEPKEVIAVNKGQGWLPVSFSSGKGTLVFD